MKFKKTYLYTLHTGSTKISLDLQIDLTVSYKTSKEKVLYYILLITTDLESVWSKCNSSKETKTGCRQSRELGPRQCCRCHADSALPPDGGVCCRPGCSYKRHLLKGGAEAVSWWNVIFMCFPNDCICLKQRKAYVIFLHKEILHPRSTVLRKLAEPRKAGNLSIAPPPSLPPVTAVLLSVSESDHSITSHTQDLSFSDGFISCSILSSGFIHVVACCRTSFSKAE